MTSVIPLDVVRSALACRKAIGAGPTDPVDIYRIAEAEGVEVRFVPVSTLEGMYVRAPKPTILLPAERPYGRKRFSCAHELGHHKLGDGTTLDLLPERSRRGSPQERAADLFAGHVLMPKLAVARGFTERGWSFAAPTAEQVLRVAQWLGVGYASLLRQMVTSLGLLPGATLSRLGRQRPRRIIESTLGLTVEANFVFVDSLWAGQAVEITVGESVIIPGPLEVEGIDITIPSEANGHSFVTGLRPGVARVAGPEVAVFVKVARRNYIGLAKYRHLRDPEYEPRTDRNR